MLEAQLRLVNNSAVSIAGREIGPHLPPYIVAEISGNHGGSFYNVHRMLTEAKAAGADAAKLQTYTPQELSNRTNFEQYREVYEKYHTPREWHRELFDIAGELDLTIFSSAFSVDGAKFLADLGAPAIKIASGEADDEKLIDAALDTGLPIIASNSTRGDVMLHCISQYPARIEDANLRVIRDWPLTKPLIGLSDHTPGYETAIAATALGAVMIEKHFKLDDNCIDAAYSLNPEQFGAMCKAVRAIWKGCQ